MERKGMLLVGHGSKLPYNKELVESTGQIIAGKYPEYIVKCAFMNMNSPSIEESLNEFKKEKIEALVIVPLFLAKGVHILQDIPGIDRSPRRITERDLFLKRQDHPSRLRRSYRFGSVTCGSNGKKCQKSVSPYLNNRMDLIVLDTIHGGSEIATALSAARAITSDAVDVYREIGGTTHPCRAPL